MEYEEDERSEYNTSEVDWGQESNPSWSGEEDYDYGSWEGETDSEISLEEVDERDEEPWYEETNSKGAFKGEEGQVDDEIEPEPPDHSQDDESHKSWCGAETNQEESEGEGCEGDSWRGETESQFSLEEDLPNGETQISHGDEGFNHDGEPDQFLESYTQDRPWCGIPYSDQEEDRQEEADSKISLREDESHGVETWSHEGESNYGDESDRGEEEIDHTKDQPTLWGDEEDYEPQYLTFSGYSQGTEDYLHWEEDMEACFQSCHVPEEEQLSYALDTLTGPAYEWWEQEENARVKYNEPAHTWRSFKLEIYEEFVKEAAAQHQQHMPNYSYTKPRRWILATTPKVKATPEKTCSPKPNKTFAPILEEKREAKLPTRAKAEPPMSSFQAIIHKSSTKPLLKLQCTGTQGKSTILSKSKEIICYRCHKRGHFAANCPIRQVDKSPSLISKLDACLVPSRVEISNSSLMLLSMPKAVDAGQQKEHEAEDIEGGISIEKPRAAQPPIQTRGESVLRSKHFQEGEYDEDIKSATTTDHGGDTIKKIQTLGENQIKHSKDLSAFIEAHQPNRYWNETVALFFPYLGFIPMGLPREVFNEATPSHKGINEKWNRFRSFPHEEDIQVTSQQTSKEPAGDQRMLIGGFRPEQNELSYKVNFATFLTHERSSSSWNQVKTNFGLGAINFLNRSSLHLPYLDAHGFRRLQTYLWRPGEFKILLEAPYSILRCTKMHGIRRILPLIHFPYPEPRLPYLSYLELFSFKLEQLFFHMFECVLETLPEHKRLPRTHHFLPKHSRYKPQDFPYLARFAH